jgi:hypothetical protein
MAHYGKEMAELAEAPIIHTLLEIINRNNRYGMYTKFISYARSLIAKITMWVVEQSDVFIIVITDNAGQIIIYCNKQKHIEWLKSISTMLF